MEQSLSYADRATLYARDITAGKIPASLYTRLACQRHLDDLNRQNTDAFPFVFNPLMQNQMGEEYRPADRICKFIELLPHVKGKWARESKSIKLENWQVFILSVTFGWIHLETALRRFRTSYTEVPRKNAKTTLAAGIGLYLELLDDEAGAEVISAATSADQASISWNIAKRMVEKSPGMQRRFGVKAYAHSIVAEHSGSSFKYLSSDHKTLDGLNVSGAIMDEVHAMRTREVWDVVETATGSREQPMIVAITTAGSNRAGICFEQREYTIKLLLKTAVDETYFGIIYTIDDDDDWTTPAAWEKANPNLGVSVYLDDLQRKCDKAVTMAGAQNNFKTKHLDVWVSADVAWMNMQAWDAMKDETLDENEFIGQECFNALDLASKKDIAANIKLFKKQIEGVTHYYVFGKYYLPEETIYTSPNDQYTGWMNEGLLTGTPGNVIDYEFIEADLLQAASDYQVVEYPYDPFQATQLSTRMLAEGLPMVEMRPTVLNFSEPMKELEALVLQKRIHHNGDPILTWMISNTVCHTDVKSNIYPRKANDREENKIDGVVALIMALGRAITVEIAGASVYESRGIITL